MSSPWPSTCVRSLILPFYFFLYLPLLFLFFNYMKSVVNLYNSCNESVDSTDEFSLPTGYEPKAHDFFETTVEPCVAALGLAAALLQQSLFCGPRTTMTLHSKTRSIKYIERKPVTLCKKTCLSVCRRRQCPIEQGNLLEIDRCDPVSTEAQKHRLGLYLKSKERQLSRNIAKKSVITNSKQFTQKKSADSYGKKYGVSKRIFVKFINKVLQRWRNYEKFQSSTFDTLAKLIEDQNTIMELSGRLQELKNEVNCMDDSKDFQDAESVRSGNSHVTSQPRIFPQHPIPEGMLRHSFVSLRRKEGPPSIWDTHGISGNVFADPPASSSAPYPQELHHWNSSIEEPLQTSTVEKSERQKQDQDQRCQSRPSAKNSVIFSGGDSSKNHGADQQPL